MSSSREASVAETVVSPWNDTGSVTGRSQPTSSAVSDKLNIIRQVLRSLPRQRLVHQTAEFEVDPLDPLYTAVFPYLFFYSIYRLFVYS